MPASNAISSTTLDTAYQKVLDLVNKFERNQAHYLNPTYSEAALRQDYLDRLFMALGWDVTHDTQTNPAEQEVKIERGVTMGVARKRADYAFYLMPNYRDVRFYVEAKKPSVTLDTNVDAHFQTVRYGWNSTTPLAVLTDFEQFHILDCRAIPHIDTALQRILKKFHYTDFKDREKFAEVYWLFSHEALESGAHDRYIAELPKPKAVGQQMGLLRTGVQRVDEIFLAQLEQHRETLAKSFNRSNPELDGFELTEVTQRVLDRLVFLRFLEDKLIETEINVNDIANSAAPWATFIRESRRLDTRYNGVVYKPHPLIDVRSKFRVDDADFKAVCDALSDKHSPFNFDVIPIHILGSIYERFLGKVITTPNKRAKVEEKPEVRKAGGVYYTPEYIVRYIVDQTVGVQIGGKTPKQIAGMRFADIACGSGSFLLGVFDVLLRYHTRWFNEHPAEAQKAGCARTDEGAWRLSLKQRQSILLNNVFGVDIDQQAVEVSQVSLYLKLLEDETTSSSNQYSLAFKEALLPPLGKNVVCGNSLIGTDVLEGQMFPREEERALNAMDFEAAFPAVMRQGGFDAVVGNPPYVRMEEFKPIKSYLASSYECHANRADLYAYFLERESKLLRKGGFLGVIVSNKFLRANYGKPLREVLLRQLRVIEIADFAGLPVFREATVRTIVFIATNESNEIYEFRYLPPVDVDTFSKIEKGTSSLLQVRQEKSILISSKSLGGEMWSLGERSTEGLLTKLRLGNNTLTDYCDGLIGMGVKSGLNDAFIVGREEYEGLIQRNPICKKHLKPFLNGREVRRYQLDSKDNFVIYAYHGVDFRDCPEILERMRPYKAALERRATKQKWYELQQPQLRYSKLLESPKIIFPDMAVEPRFALDQTGSYCANTCYFIGKFDLYLLGILNSKLGYFYFKQVCAGLESKGETYLRFFGQYLEGMPVHSINLADRNDKAQHDRLVKLVDDMLNAKEALAAARSERDTDYYTRRCEALDRQIDALVYELYGLTDEEIALVEGGSSQVAESPETVD